jgi:hypothetical protein
MGLLIPTVTIQTYIVDCFRGSSASVTGKKKKKNFFLLHSFFANPNIILF